MKKRQPLWQIKKEMEKLTLELSLLQKDPSTNYDEIAIIDSKLSVLKAEYARRRFEIAESINPKGVVS